MQKTLIIEHLIQLIYTYDYDFTLYNTQVQNFWLFDDV